MKIFAEIYILLMII